MKFTILLHKLSAPASATSEAFLLTDNWDDYTYKTTYTLVVFDATGSRHEIGSVKIGQFGMVDTGRPVLPQTFSTLDESFFSLGQDRSYYESLRAIGDHESLGILRSLRDIAFDASLFQRALKEDVTLTSLLRSVPRKTVTDQFSRIAHGGSQLSKYDFAYHSDKTSGKDSTTLSFIIAPDLHPPTNIHVLIGRNGVGKTYLLSGMTRALLEPHNAEGSFSASASHDVSPPSFVNVVSVTFSAFDNFDNSLVSDSKSTGIRYTYVGLKRPKSASEPNQFVTSTPDELSQTFAASLEICRQGARGIRWRHALEVLEADPGFKDADVAALAENGDRNFQSRAHKLFNGLSSGHKIILLTITRLVEAVEEGTLVLIDEPEAHLHPPLLAAFVRALSNLLINRNGVAIIATHSPVVLQEVPKSCVWKIRRNGSRVVAERPERETFGENVGVLTREVFGLEVEQSGFHKMLIEEAARTSDFDRIVERFHGELGGEARAIIRALIATTPPND